MVVDRKGTLHYLRWLGFICIHGAEALGHGGVTKMEATCYTAGDGGASSAWVTVPAGEHLAVWWVPHNEPGCKNHAIYTLVDDRGSPYFYSA